MNLILDTLIKFWQEHPGLFYGVTFLLGFYGALHGTLLLLIPCLFLWGPFILAAYQRHMNGSTQLFFSLIFMLTTWIYGICYIQSSFLTPEGITGTAHIDIQSLTFQSTYFGKRWLYRCQLKSFFPDNPPSSTSIVHHIDCSISLPQMEGLQRPLANQSYLVKGTLMQTVKGSYFLKIKKEGSWKAVKNSWSLAEKRYRAKKWLKTWIQRHISHQKSAVFLAGLVTGEFEDRLMQIEFARFGLQHIMAISGFHFAILAGILHGFCRFVFSRKVSALVIILLLGFYFLFLGCSPSILRAWIMISIALISQLIERPGKALNSLGIALLGVLGIDPLLCQTLGFQFSFLVTLAILLIHPIFNYYLNFILLQRPLSQVVEMDGWNQHGYYLLSLFRQGMALTLAVNLLGLPLTLYYFHQFPWMSLLYNLFFPLLVSFSMFLLIIGSILTYLLPPLGELIHLINSFYTTWVLNLTYHMPSSLDAYYEVQSFPSWLLVTYLCLVWMWAMIMRHRLQEKLKDRQDFAFI